MNKFKNEFWRVLVSALVAFLTALTAESCVFDNNLSVSNPVPSYEQPAV